MVSIAEKNRRRGELLREETNKRKQTVARGKNDARNQMQIIRQYIKLLIGTVPWIDHVYHCSVLKIEKDGNGKPTGRCLVDYGAKNGKPIWALHGERVPVIGGIYALRYPSKGARPWIKILSGKFLYWQYQTPRGAYEIYRIPWPPVANTEIEFLCTAPFGVGGYGYEKFIGCDGQGTLWFWYSNSVANAAVAWPENGKGLRGEAQPCGGIMPGAVDCTPGESNIIGLEIVRSKRLTTGTSIPQSFHYLGLWLHLQSDGGTTLGGGPPGPDDPQYHTGDIAELTNTCVEPGDAGKTRGEGHYNPPNDGTSDEPHFHWFIQDVDFLDPVTDLSALVNYQPLCKVHVSRNLDQRTRWAMFQTVTKDGAFQTDTYGMRIDSGFCGFPESFVSVEATKDYIVDGNCIDSMYALTERSLPTYVLSNVVVGDSLYFEPIQDYHPHIWTDDNENIVPAWPFRQFSDPLRHSGPTFREIHVWPPGAFNDTSYAIPPNTLYLPGLMHMAPGDAGKYLYTIFNIGPRDANTLRVSGTWNIGRKPRTVSSQVSFPDIDAENKLTKFYTKREGAYEQPNNPKLVEVMADGRDSLDLLAKDEAGKWWFTEDGGETWEKFLNGEPLAHAPVQGIEGFIVEGV
jgi:hypothetical protein